MILYSSHFKKVFLLTIFCLFSTLAYSNNQIVINNDKILINGVPIQFDTPIKYLTEKLGSSSRKKKRDFSKLQETHVWDKLGLKVTLMDSKIEIIDVNVNPEKWDDKKITEGKHYFKGTVIINGITITNGQSLKKIPVPKNSKLNIPNGTHLNGIFWYLNCPSGIKVAISNYAENGSISKLKFTKYKIRECRCKDFLYDTRFRQNSCEDEKIFYSFFQEVKKFFNFYSSPGKGSEEQN